MIPVDNQGDEERENMADSKRLDKLAQQMAALKEQMNAEKKRFREQAKREEERRKFLTGAICLQHAKINLTFKDTLDKLLREHVPEGDRYLWPELFAHEPANDNGQEPANDNGDRQEDTHTFHEA